MAKEKYYVITESKLNEIISSYFKLYENFDNIDKENIKTYEETTVYLYSVFPKKKYEVFAKGIGKNNFNKNFIQLIDVDDKNNRFIGIVNPNKLIKMENGEMVSFKIINENDIDPTYYDGPENITPRILSNIANSGKLKQKAFHVKIETNQFDANSDSMRDLIDTPNKDEDDSKENLSDNRIGDDDYGISSSDNIEYNESDEDEDDEENNTRDEDEDMNMNGEDVYSIDSDYSIRKNTNGEILKNSSFDTSVLNKKYIICADFDERKEKDMYYLMSVDSRIRFIIDNDFNLSDNGKYIKCDLIADSEYNAEDLSEKEIENSNKIENNDSIYISCKLKKTN